MKRKEILTSFVSILVLIVFLAVCTMPTVAGAVSPSKQKKITLRIVYEQPITDNGHTLFKIWQERVNAAAPDRLHIKYLGAYEVIPTFEQMEAVMRGTVDMAVVAPTFYSGLLPESMAIQCMGAGATVPEVRKSGMVELMDKMHRAKLGVTFLQGLWAGDHHMILLKKPVYKADLTGLKIRAIPVQQPAVKSLGGTITLVPPEEAYTALQTGLLDGVACPTVLVPDYKYEEITEYMFFPLIPMSCWVPVIVNASVWDGLPEDVKKIITDTLLELEPEVDPFFGKMEKDIVDSFLKKGLKKCGPTSEAEAKAAVSKQMKAQWKAFVEDRADPAWLPQLNAIAKPVLGLD
ncbi:MAG: TRAP transporter substrate-binding protein DctP [Desulfobacteraceae bacterium]|nr:TRAP transporter substrate-binding protein DctP [Desulfobacteraceae bacterium]